MRHVVDFGLAFEKDTQRVFIEFGPKWLQWVNDSGGFLCKVTRHRWCNSWVFKRLEKFKDDRTIKWYAPIDKDKSLEFHKAIGWPWEPYELEDE